MAAGSSGWASRVLLSLWAIFAEMEQITWPDPLFAEAVERRYVRNSAMLDTADFFEAQIKQCTDTAARSSNKADREFWLKIANRWEGLFQARQTRDADTDPVQRSSLQRFEKRRRAALAQSRH